MPEAPPRRIRPLLLLATAAAACRGGGAAPPDPIPDPPAADTASPTGAEQDILSADLRLDLAALTGQATLSVVPAEGAGVVTLEAGGLTVSELRVDGAPVTPTRAADGGLSVPVPAGEGPFTLEIAYAFSARSVEDFDGWMPDLGVTFVWPDACGNLYPCTSAPRDGLRFTLAISGVDPDQTAIYPARITADAPAYMPAVAVGPYSSLALGTTAAGTTLTAWHLPGARKDAEFGTAHLVAAFDFFESTYGPYAYGSDVATVQVDWGADSYGGMEHHPYFHVGKLDFWNEEAQIHEAAHAWFGDAVRLACWEDFVLSEGTVTYMTAVGLAEAGGVDLWPIYVSEYLGPLCESGYGNAIVLPDTCDAIDLETDPLWSMAPYMKGACFYGDVAEQIGQDRLDAAIADFYQRHAGQAARMRDLIQTLEDWSEPKDGPAIEALAEEWLLSLACPEDYAARCAAHGAGAAR